MDIWGSVTPPILVTENTSLGISVTIVKIRNKNKWFTYPSFGTLKRNKENFNIAIGDGNIGISKNCQPEFLWFFKLQYLLNLRMVPSEWLPLISNVLRKRNPVFEIRGRVFNRCDRFILYSPLEAAAKLNSLRCLSRQCCHWKYFYKVVS